MALRNSIPHVVNHANSGHNTALDLPFLLLPFRPTSDPSAVRTFVRHFFDLNNPMRGETLLQELRMAEPMVRFRSLYPAIPPPAY